MFILALSASNVILFLGALPESATILFFGTCLIVSTIGIRKFMIRPDEKNADKKDNSEERGN